MEQCSRCGAVKPESDFPPRRGTGKVLRPRMCLECKRASDVKKSRKYEEGNAPARRARWHSDPGYRAKGLQASKSYRDRMGDGLRAKTRAYRAEIRATVLALYGGKCECCGDAHQEFLAVDHVNGGGNQERKTESVVQLYVRLSRSAVDPKYRLLCHNCNQSRGLYGYCPHEKETA